MANSNQRLVSALGVAGFLACSASALAQNSKPSGAATAVSTANDSTATRAQTSTLPSDEQPPTAPDAATSTAPSPADTGSVTAAPGAAAPGAHEQPPAPVTQTTPSPQGAGEQASTGATAPQSPPPGEHEGFYLRMALGTGTATVKLKDAPAGLDYAIEQAGGLDVMVGGTPRRGIAVGGGLWARGFSTREWRGENRAEGSAILFGVGPFIDYFPDPDGGFHVGGTVGIGGLQIDAEPFSSDEDRMANGTAAGVWVGYDFRVYRQWSLGVDARYLGVRAKHPEDDWKGTGDCFGLSLTGLYY
jgi:hypothetical protein